MSYRYKLMILILVIWLRKVDRYCDSYATFVAVIIVQPPTTTIVESLDNRRSLETTYSSCNPNISFSPSLPSRTMMQPPAPPHQQRAPTKTLGISQSDASAARLTQSVQIRKSKKQRRTADRRKLPSLSTVTFAELEVHLNNFLSDPSYRRAPNLDKFIALMSQPHGLYPLELLNQCIPHLTSLLPVTISVFQTLSASFPPKTLHLEHIIPYVSPPHSLVIRNIAVRIFSNCAATAEGRQVRGGSASKECEKFQSISISTRGTEVLLARRSNLGKTSTPNFRRCAIRLAKP